MAEGLVMAFQEKRKQPRFKISPSLLCLFSLDTIGGKAVERRKPAQGEIFDISEGGVRLATDLVLPVENSLEVTMVFNLHNFSFERKARLLYQQDGIPPTYGASFVDKLSKNEELRFHRALRIIENEYQFGIYSPLNIPSLKDEDSQA